MRSDNTWKIFKLLVIPIMAGWLLGRVVAGLPGPWEAIGLAIIWLLLVLAVWNQWNLRPHRCVVCGSREAIPWVDSQQPRRRMAGIRWQRRDETYLCLDHFVPWVQMRLMQTIVGETTHDDL